MGLSLFKYKKKHYIFLQTTLHRITLSVKSNFNVFNSVIGQVMGNRFLFIFKVMTPLNPGDSLYIIFLHNLLLTITILYFSVFNLLNPLTKDSFTVQLELD